MILMLGLGTGSSGDRGASVPSGSRGILTVPMLPARNEGCAAYFDISGGSGDECEVLEELSSLAVEELEELDDDVEGLEELDDDELDEDMGQRGGVPVLLQGSVGFERVLVWRGLRYQ